MTRPPQSAIVALIANQRNSVTGQPVNGLRWFQRQKAPPTNQGQRGK